MRLLVAEDERDLAQTLRRALEEEEFAVDLAEDLKAAAGHRRFEGADRDPRLQDHLGRAGGGGECQ